MNIKYPNITVHLTGSDGNAFAVLGVMKKALKRGFVPQEEIDSFYKEATSGDYDNLLKVCMSWVDVR